jgi:hypothetical protein
MNFALRPPPPDVPLHYVNYRITRTDGSMLDVDGHELASQLSRPDVVDVALQYSMNRVDVDGVLYRRPIETINQPSFYTYKPVPDPHGEDEEYGPADHVPWDAPFVQRHKCDICKNDWALNEFQYLKKGDISCLHCGPYRESPESPENTLSEHRTAFRDEMRNAAVA